MHELVHGCIHLFALVITSLLYYYLSYLKLTHQLMILYLSSMPSIFEMNCIFISNHYRKTGLC